MGLSLLLGSHLRRPLARGDLTLLVDGHFVTDDAAGRCTRQGVVTSDVTRNPADHGAGETPGLGWSDGERRRHEGDERNCERGFTNHDEKLSKHLGKPLGEISIPPAFTTERWLGSLCLG